MIKTENLHLILCERIHREAMSRHKDELGTLLQVAIPAGWPTFPEAFALTAEDRSAAHTPGTGWNGYLFIHPVDRVLVGNGGFKGEPDASGRVELGYEIAPEYRNRGFATGAVRGMLAYAFAHDAVQTVIAHTLAEKNASTSVLQKAGMKFLAEIEDAAEGKIWQWGIRRDAYRPT